MFGEGEHQPDEVCEHDNKIGLYNIYQLADQLIVGDGCVQRGICFILLIIEVQSHSD